MEAMERERHEATLRDYLGIMFRQKWVILIVLAIPTITVLTQTIGSRTLYKSTSTVLLRRGQRESAIVPYVTVLPWEETVSSEEQTATSAVVIAKAQEILDRWQTELGSEESIRIRPGSVEAGIVGESNVLAISYTDYEPAVARRVTQALTDAYMAYRQETSLAPELMGFFDTQIEEIKAKLGELRHERELFMREHNVNNLDWKSRTLLDMWGKATEKLNDATVMRIGEEAKLEQMKRLHENPDIDLPVLPGSVTPSDELIQGLRQTRANMRLELERMQTGYTDKDQRVVALKRQLADVEEQLKAQINQAIVVAEARLAPIVANEAELRKQVTYLEEQLMDYPRQDAVLSDLNSRIGILERDYETLTSKKIDAMVSKESSPEWEVILLSPPSTPTALRTKDYVRLSLGPLLGLLVGIGLAFLFDSLDHSVKTKTEAESLLGLPVLASVVDLKEWDTELKEPREKQSEEKA